MSWRSCYWESKLLLRSSGRAQGVRTTLRHKHIGIHLRHGNHSAPCV
jgi:hypothetical protein